MTMEMDHTWMKRLVEAAQIAVNEANKNGVGFIMIDANLEPIAKNADDLFKVFDAATRIKKEALILHPNDVLK